MNQMNSANARLNYRMVESAWNLEPLSPKLRAFVNDLYENRSLLAEKITESIKAEIPIYQRTASPRLHQEIFSTAKFNLGNWYRALLFGSLPFNDDYREHSENNIRRRVKQGISQSALAQAYRIGANHYWLALLEAVGEDEELQKELLYSVSPNFNVFRDMHFDQIIEIYFDEKQRHLDWGQRIKTKFINLLLDDAGDDDDAEFERLADSLNIDGRATYTSIAFSGIEDDALASVSNKQIQLAVSYAARVFGIDRSQIINVVNRGCLLIWVMRAHGMPVYSHTRHMSDSAARILQKMPELGRAGIGLPGLRASGWRMSAFQAMKAINVGRRFSDQPVLNYSDIAIDEAILASPDALRFIESITERLSGEAELLETLRVYFALRQQRKRTAAALNIHPNTLSYRLGRVEVLLDGSFDDLSWLSRLYTAMRIGKFPAAGKAVPDHSASPTD